MRNYIRQGSKQLVKAVSQVKKWNVYVGKRQHDAQIISFFKNLLLSCNKKREYKHLARIL